MPFSRTVRADAEVASCMASGCTSAASMASWYQRCTWTSGSASTSPSSSATSSTGGTSDVELQSVDVLVARDAQRALGALGRARHLQLGGHALQVGHLRQVVLVGGRLGHHE